MILQKLILRVIDFFFKKEYRRVKIVRILNSLLQRFNKNIRYIGIEHDGEIQIVFVGDKFFTPDILANGDFQRQELINTIEIIEKEGLKTGGLFLDIGANIGTSTLYALWSKKFSHAVCFEPVLENLNLLRANVAANQLDDRVKIIASGLSNEQRSGKISLNPINHGDNRIVSDQRPYPSNADKTESWDTALIQLTTLDEILKTENIDSSEISLIWIDTQGHEGFVLDGARKILGSSIPICLELWPRGLREAGSDTLLVELLEKNYSHFYDLADKQMTKKNINMLGQLVEHLFVLDQHTDIVVVGGSSKKSLC